MFISQLRVFFRVFSVFTLLFLSPFASSYASTTKTQSKDQQSSNGPTPTALRYAINGYLWALQHNEVGNKSVLTVIDFTLPSYEKRLWVIDLHNNHVLMSMHVAQGKNTGAVYATHFSNSPGSRSSSPGLYVTAGEYDGEHGRSMRVNGLEPGINSNAMERAIVIHPASYVTPDFIKQNGYAGRSWGCFAVDPNLAPKFMRNINNRTVLFAYASSERSDPTVNHGLSAQGEAIYRGILTSSGESVHDNPISRFFAAIRQVL